MHLLLPLSLLFHLIQLTTLTTSHSPRFVADHLSVDPHWRAAHDAYRHIYRATQAHTRCASSPTNASLLIGVVSALRHNTRRQALRQSWTAQSGCACFIIGISMDGAAMRAAMKEADAYEDMLFVPVIESYDNVVLKTLQFLHWAASAHAPEMAIKVDDDVFVHVPALWKLMTRLSESKEGMVYAGHVWRGRPLRDTRHKNHVRFEDFPFGFYPEYVQGAFMAFNRNAYQALLRASPVLLHGFLIESSGNLEDVQLGLWMHMIGITPTHIPGIVNPELCVESAVAVYDLPMSILQNVRQAHQICSPEIRTFAARKLVHTLQTLPLHPADVWTHLLAQQLLLGNMKAARVGVSHALDYAPEHEGLQQQQRLIHEYHACLYSKEISYDRCRTQVADTVQRAFEVSLLVPASPIEYKHWR